MPRITSDIYDDLVRHLEIVEEEKERCRNLTAELGSALLEKMRVRKLSIRELAKRVDLPQPRVVNWLYGNACPPPKEALKLIRTINKIPIAHEFRVCRKL
jgi:DNA-binding transcriptional regulator YiaG